MLLFILGDVLGAGVYVLIGQVAGEVGGAVWAPFLLALAFALFTAFSYAELVTRFPQAGGAAVFVHRAFGNRLLSFVVGFAMTGRRSRPRRRWRRPSPATTSPSSSRCPAWSRPWPSSGSSPC